MFGCLSTSSHAASTFKGTAWDFIRRVRFTCTSDSLYAEIARAADKRIDRWRGEESRRLVQRKPIAREEGSTEEYDDPVNLDWEEPAPRAAVRSEALWFRHEAVQVRDRGRLRIRCSCFLYAIGCKNFTTTRCTEGDLQSRAAARPHGQTPNLYYIILYHIN